MKKIFTLIFALVSIISYSQEQKQDYIKVDQGSLGIQTTTVTVKTRDEIEQRIEQYNRELEAKFMEREEWVKLLNQCDKLEIVATPDTTSQQVTEKSSSILGTGHLKITDINPNTVGGPEKVDSKASGEIKKAKKKK